MLHMFRLHTKFSRFFFFIWRFQSTKNSIWLRRAKKEKRYAKSLILLVKYPKIIWKCFFNRSWNQYSWLPLFFVFIYVSREPFCSWHHKYLWFIYFEMLHILDTRTDINHSSLIRSRVSMWLFCIRKHQTDYYYLLIYYTYSIKALTEISTHKIP